MILKARMVVPMDSAPVEDGAIFIDANRIRGLGTLEEMRALGGGEVWDLGERVILPGLINAHCHLDYTMMRGAISPPSSFTAWVQRINALKRSLDSNDYLAAIARGFTELKRWGTTTVCNMEAFPELMPQLPPAPIRTWWFYEMIDIRLRFLTDEVLAGAFTFFEEVGDGPGGFGLNPHAPYTASRELFKLANDCASLRAPMPLSTHVAESREEMAMFRDRAGSLFDFLAGLGRPMEDCGHATPFALLWESGAIDSRWILAHMNELAESDFSLLESLPRGTGPHVVHCPGSHQYFHHSPFAFRRLHELGINICLGTDSLASNSSLSLFEELRRVQALEPWLGAEALLSTVTLNPARALGRVGDLGCIRVGALADLIALPFSGTMSQVHEAILAYNQPVSWMMIDGKILS